MMLGDLRSLGSRLGFRELILGALARPAAVSVDQARSQRAATVQAWGRHGVYELEEIGTPDLKAILGTFVASLKG